jgi:hypothetical protein
MVPALAGRSREVGRGTQGGAVSSGQAAVRCRRPGLYEGGGGQRWPRILPGTGGAVGGQQESAGQWDSGPGRCAQARTVHTGARTAHSRAHKCTARAQHSHNTQVHGARTELTHKCTAHTQVHTPKSTFVVSTRACTHMHSHRAHVCTRAYRSV